jgi:hypothetical protein
MRLRGKRIIAIGTAVLSLVCGLTLGVLASSWWIGIAGGFAYLVLGGGLSMLLLATGMTPTVLCRSCPGHGWILDLKPTQGACPRCGNDKYDYRRTTVGSANMPVSLDMHDVSGSELVARANDEPLHYI